MWRRHTSALRARSDAALGKHRHNQGTVGSQPVHDACRCTAATRAPQAASPLPARHRLLLLLLLPRRGIYRHESPSRRNGSGPTQGRDSRDLSRWPQAHTASGTSYSTLRTSTSAARPSGLQGGSPAQTVPVPAVAVDPPHRGQVRAPPNHRAPRCVGLRGRASGEGVRHDTVAIEAHSH